MPYTPKGITYIYHPSPSFMSILPLDNFSHSQIQTAQMAPPALSLILALSLMSFFASSCLARDFSIVGYTPEDLTSRDRIMDLFESWISKHQKIYESIEEKWHRFEIFKDNLFHIDETNKKVVNYWLGLNEFADLSHEEFKNKYLGLNVDLSNRRECSEEFTYKDVSSIPKSVDWRKKGAVTDVKNQGSCGRCPMLLHLYLVYLQK
jgi:xylem cysteine proteinase